MNLIDVVNKNYARKDLDQKLPELTPGDTVAVNVRITEGDKTRLQVFEGVIIALKGSRNSTDGHFRVRKISAGYGVERLFPYHSPNVDSVKVLKRGKVRRAKHFYLRERTGKSARIDTDYSSYSTPGESKE